MPTSINVFFHSMMWKPRLWELNRINILFYCVSYLKCFIHLIQLIPLASSYYLLYLVKTRNITTDTHRDICMHRFIYTPHIDHQSNHLPQHSFFPANSKKNEEKDAAFDLLDMITKSGAIPLSHATLHVILCATHCFDPSSAMRGRLEIWWPPPIEDLTSRVKVFRATVATVVAFLLYKGGWGEKLWWGWVSSLKRVNKSNEVNLTRQFLKWKLESKLVEWNGYGSKILGTPPKIDFKTTLPTQKKNKHVPFLRSLPRMEIMFEVYNDIILIVFGNGPFWAYVGVSKNNGTPKTSILIGFSIINHPFWGTTIFGNTQCTSRYHGQNHHHHQHHQILLTCWRVWNEQVRRHTSTNFFYSEGFVPPIWYNIFDKYIFNKSNHIQHSWSTT